jgi:RNA polymerase sigma-70 factor (ECF subfamily)
MTLYVVPQTHSRVPDELWKCLQTGDPRAGALLYDTFRDLVERLVWRMLGNDPDSPDVVQRAFVHLLGSARSVREPKALVNWVKTVTTNTVRDELKRRRSYRATNQEDELPDVPSSARADSSDLLRRILRILDTLDIDERLAFHLRYVEECKLEEAALFCDCSLATFKRRLQRAEAAFTEKAKADPFLSEWAVRSEEGVA